MMFAIQKKITFVMIILFSAQLFPMAQKTFLDRSIQITDLPQDAVLKIINAKFHDLLIEGNHIPVMESEDRRAALVEGREKYYTHPTECFWARVQNLRCIKAFMLTNKLWARWLASSDFTHRFIKAALFVDPANEISFELEKTWGCESPNGANRTYGRSQTEALFSSLLSNFRTAGARSWLKQLFISRPEAIESFRRFMKFYGTSPKFIEQTGVPLNSLDDSGYSPLQNLLTDFGDDAHVAQRTRIIAAMEYVLRTVSVDPTSLESHEIPIVTAILDKIKNEPKFSE